MSGYVCKSVWFIVSDEAFQQNIRRKILYLQLAAKIIKQLSADDQVCLCTLSP